MEENMASKPKRAALYLRVSTDGQTVDNQRLVLEAVCEQPRSIPLRVSEDCALVPGAAEQALIAHARGLRSDGATLRAIQAVLEAQHGRKLSLDALHRVLEDTAQLAAGTARQNCRCHHGSGV
jgi:hypothetical protein